MDLTDLKWKEFIIGEVFEVKNSKAYHKINLSSAINGGFPYIARTRFNNGLDSFVEEENDFIKNPKDVIVFGAESACFFYEPFEFITGNKMYYIFHERFNKHICLFLVAILNNAIGDSNFNYGYGLTGSRLKNVRLLLPTDNEGNPNYSFMENFMKDVESKQTQKYRDYIGLLKEFNFSEIDSLESVEWKEFFITDIGEVKSGKDITKQEMADGMTPYISSTSLNNGISGFVSNENSTLEKNCISINRNGSIGYAFYHPYAALFSNDCRKLITNKNKYISLFIANQIKAQKDKYNYSYKMGTGRLKRQKIMLPVDEDGNPNYDYMEQYMKNIEFKLLKGYVDYLESN